MQRKGTIARLSHMPHNAQHASRQIRYSITQPVEMSVSYLKPSHGTSQWHMMVVTLCRVPVNYTPSPVPRTMLQ